ncbi:MAG: CBS domain-containing protein, partial [Gammaproteobacteria bacterium]|nr:CBS domain-containing protein [Gammaproteobacteria bacterium]
MNPEQDEKPTIEATSDTSTNDLLQHVIAELEAGNSESIAQRLEETHPAEVADLLESMTPEQRSDLWETVPVTQEAEVLSHLGDEVRASIIDEMEDGELIAAAESMAPEDLVEMLDELPTDISTRLMDALEQDHRNRLEAILNYEEDSAGRLMSSDVISVREDVSIAVVLRWLRRHKDLPSHTDSLMVTDDSGLYLGKLDLADVITGDPD